METTLYTAEGKAAGKVKIPERVFGARWNADLVHQVVTSMLSSARSSIAHTKDRSEVRGGGKKPWKQKGTGQARHGSRRSPIWVGGGVAHGPRNEKNYDRKVNKTMKTAALYAILSKKFRDGEVTFIDSMPSTGKTKDAVGALATMKSIDSLKDSLSRRKKNAVLFAMPSVSDTEWKSYRNIGNVSLEEARTMSPVTAMTYRHIVIVSPEASIRALEDKKALKKKTS
jgi:large subunit ribosomal protein L4